MNENKDGEFFGDEKNNKTESEIDKSESNISITKVDIANEKTIEIEETKESSKESDCFFDSRNAAADKAVEMGSKVRMAPAKSKKRQTVERVVSLAMSALILVLTFLFGFMTAYYNGNQDATVASWMVDQINNHAYFANQKVTSYDLMKYGIDGVLQDPYAAMMNPEETKAMYAQNEGKSTSIGMTVAEFTNVQGIVVVDLTKGSSAEKAGVKLYYKLLEVDGEDCRAFSIDQMTAKITSIPDNKNFVVKFGVPDLRKDTLDYSKNETVDLTLRRSEYVTEVVTYYDNNSEGFEDILDDKTAYIELDSFMGDTVSQFDKAMKQFKKNGKTKLILDLRNNLGGSDYNLQGVANHLLKDGDNDNILILTEKYKDGSERKLYTEKSLYDEYNFEKIIVLVKDRKSVV